MVSRVDLITVRPLGITVQLFALSSDFGIADGNWSDLLGPTDVQVGDYVGEHVM